MVKDLGLQTKALSRAYNTKKQLINHPFQSLTGTKRKGTLRLTMTCINAYSAKKDVILALIINHV